MEFETHKKITPNKQKFIDSILDKYDADRTTHLSKILSTDIYSLSEEEAWQYYSGAGCGFIEFDYHNGLMTDLRYAIGTITFETIGSKEQNFPYWKRGHYKNVMVNDKKIRLAVNFSCCQLLRCL